MLLKNFRLFLTLTTFSLIVTFMCMKADVEKVSQNAITNVATSSAVENEKPNNGTASTQTGIDEAAIDDEDFKAPETVENKDLLSSDTKESTVEVEEEIALNSDTTSDEGLVNSIDDNLMTDLDDNGDDDDDDNLF